ncbi:MAG TPA: hypothetical protein VH188_04710 [Chthoniobacterales bacterium]|jgi:hypothetical protein|nr:hypothetical protein [Chthoniobacterales bacterium]
MRAIALLIAALMVLLGLTGVLWPEGLMPLLTYSFTGTGIYAAAAIRVVLGALLFIAARATRTPKTVRVIGLIILLAGIATALIPVERAQMMKDWWIERGPDTLRIVACLPLLAGIIVGISALTADRKA